MGFTPSKFQTAVFNWVKQGSGNAIIEAVAGSGKTTTIVEALRLIPVNQSVVFLAFNKDIAEELKSRVPAHVQASTLNSLGHRALGRHLGRVNLDSNKTRELMNQFRDDYAPDVWDNIYTGARKLVGLAKSEGIVPEGIPAQGLVADTDAVWDDLIDHHDIYFGDRKKSADRDSARAKQDREFAIGLARNVLRKSIEMCREVIDFDDQIYLTVILDVQMYQFDWVFVDEAQDVSAIQRALITKVLKRNGRLCVVGDPRQAIYGFRGADSASLDNIAKQFNTARLPLSVSYRCPKAVVAEAKKVVSHIEYHDDSPDGEVQTLGLYTDQTPFSPGELVVCRANAPLVRLAYRLISRRIPVKVLGRDIGQGLISLIEKLKPKSIDDLEEKIYEWHSKECARRMRKDPEADLSDVDDKKEVILIFSTSSGAKTVDQVLSAIQNLFSGDRKGNSKAIDSTVLNLSTIHKSKGLEAHTVYFLDRGMLPSKYAKKPHHQAQEQNLIYVAITRAKSRLLYIDSPQR